MLKAEAEREQLLKKKHLERERIIAIYRNKYELARIKVKDLSERLEATKAELLDMNDIFARYTALNQEKTRNVKVLDALLANIKKINITAESDDIQIWPMKTAELPKRPVRTGRTKHLVYGMLLGFASGVFLAFALEGISNSPSNIKDL